MRILPSSVAATGTTTTLAAVRKNSAGSEFARRRLNLIEGANVTLTVADDAGSDEVDITLAAATAAVQGYQRSESGSVVETVDDKLGDLFTVEDFGAVGDGATDDLAAFDLAIAAMTATGSHGVGGTFTRGLRLRLAAKTYRLSGTLHITRPLILAGPAGDGWFPAAILSFPASTVGVELHDGNTLSGNSVSASWAALENVALQGSAGATVGTVNTAGLDVTWAAGTKFNASTGPDHWGGRITITIGGATFVVDTITDAEHLSVLPWRAQVGVTNGSATVTTSAPSLFLAAWVGASVTVNGAAHTIAAVAGNGLSLTLNAVYAGATTTEAQFVLLGIGTQSGVAYRANVFHGIDSHVSCRLAGVVVTGFAGNAFHLDTERHGLAGQDTNANNFAVTRCSGLFTKGHGFFARGVNANNGIVTGCDFGNNLGAGVWEEGFLGNHYVGCHAAYNAQGAYVAPSVLGWNTWLGCYAEGGQPASRFGQNSLVLGGDHGAGISAETEGLVIAGGNTAHAATVTALRALRTIGGTRLSDDDDGANSTAGFLGANDDTGTALGFSSGDESGWPTPAWRLTYGNVAAGWWTFIHNLLGGREALMFSGENADVGPGKLGIPNGFYLGLGATRRFWDVGTAAPVSGAHIIGDIVWNVSPSAGGVIGWVCTSAGTPGTFKAFGTIAS